MGQSAQELGGVPDLYNTQVFPIMTSGPPQPPNSALHQLSALHALSAAPVPPVHPSSNQLAVQMPAAASQPPTQMSTSQPPAHTTQSSGQSAPDQGKMDRSQKLSLLKDLLDQLFT